MGFSMILAIIQYKLRNYVSYRSRVNESIAKNLASAQPEPQPPGQQSKKRTKEELDQEDSAVDAKLEATLKTLAEFYGVNDIQGALDKIASASNKPTWAHFKDLNKFGFIYGVLVHSPDNVKLEYIDKVETMFVSSQPQSEEKVEDFLELLKARFITPLMQHSGSTGGTPTPHESPLPSLTTNVRGSLAGQLSAHSALDLNLPTEASNLTHANFQKALHERDKVCLFCWGEEALHPAHLISQKKFDSFELIIRDLLGRAGMDSVYRVQNGVLLCAVCHSRFDNLKRYIDVVDGRYIAKVINVNPSNHSLYREEVETIKDIRTGKVNRRRPVVVGRDAPDENDDLPIYFVDSRGPLHPNHSAISFHKAACLIWHLAGAADETEDDHDFSGNVDGLLAKVRERLGMLRAV
ncbi:hypothetical protein HDU76_006011 [Blyttiomyces sp. JEL0837]|nr:hypothetical protein HDU76_006011 [Blyttiomyces sp. JEL0837]